MQDDRKADQPITLDMTALLGVSLIAKLSTAADEARLGRVFSKIGEAVESPSLAAALLSKIGEGIGSAS